MRAIQITEFGGPEVLVPAQLPEPVPTGRLQLLDVDAAGVNFADTHQSDDSYLVPQRLPLVPGAEAVGRRRDDGTRVVALLPAAGGYAEVALAHPATTVPLPDEVDDAAALALVLQGTTAWHLLRSSARMARGETVVVHAAAGGVGSLAVQLARLWGAGRVVATASTRAKRDLALDLGADVAVDVSGCPDADAVRGLLLEATDGGADVVLEMTGGHVTDGSLAALRPFGRLLVYGNASRQAPTPVDPRALMARSTSVAGFWLSDVLRRADGTGLGQAMDELLAATRSGLLRPVVGGRYPLDDAAAAHRDLLGRGTTGKLVLEVTGRPAGHAQA